MTAIVLSTGGTTTVFTIGISSPWFSLRPFPEIFELIEPRFKLWEIVVDGEHALEKIKLDLLQFRANSKLDFSFHAPYGDLNIASINPVIRKVSIRSIMNTIELAAEAEVLRVTFHPGRPGPLSRRQPEYVARLNREAIAKIGEHAAEFGVIVAVENMPYKEWTTGSTPEELQAMIGESGIGICLDIGHAHIAGELEHLLELHELFVNIHLHDNTGKKDAHSVIGQGTIPIKPTLDRILESYVGDVVLEQLSLEDGLESKRILEEWYKS